MIRIYDKDVKTFDNLGLGSLNESLAAVVVEELNGAYELEIEYPISGRHFDKIKLQNIIRCKPNVNTDEQPFRIYSIEKPIDGVITINAEHISYDSSSIIILPKRNDISIESYIRENNLLGPYDIEDSGNYTDNEEARLDLENNYPAASNAGKTASIENSKNNKVYLYQEQTGAWVYVEDKIVEFSDNWISETEGGDSLEPDPEGVYIVKTEGDHENEFYVWQIEFGKFNKVNNYAFEVLSYGDKVQKDPPEDTTEGYYMDSILADIKDYSAIQNGNPFNITRHISKENVFLEEGFKVGKPTNLRSILGGSDGALIGVFEGELMFDNFDITIMKERGSDKGVSIRYGKNMTDLDHESESVGMYTSVFPFYSKAYTETYTSSEPDFQSGYITTGVTPFRAEWLSVEISDPTTGIGGISFKPIVDVIEVTIDGIEQSIEKHVPIEVQTQDTGDDEFFEKIYTFKKNHKGTEDDPTPTLFDVYIQDEETDEEGNFIKPLEFSLDEEGNNIVVPEFGMIYVVKNIGHYSFGRSYIYDNSEYQKYDSDGFYIEVQDATPYKNTKPFPLAIPLYPLSYNEETKEWEKDLVDGEIYVRPFWPRVGTKSIDKYVYVDLLNHSSPEASELILENGLLYMTQENKDKVTQRVLSLDMTSELDGIGGLDPTDMTKEHLFNKTEEYMKDNDFTEPKESIKISFIKLSESPEYKQFKDLEIVELGDEVSVVYEKLGVNSKHRVISTEYNVLTDSYIEIELGEAKKKITNTLVTTSDGVSSLKNDKGYTDRDYIVQLITENLEAVNAEIQNAVIETLKVGTINVSGLLQASVGTIDQIISQLVTSESAEIAKKLIAGSVRVKGDITLDNGAITINRKAEEECTDAYIRDDSTPMGYDWLSLTEGGDMIDPEASPDTIYKIVTDGGYSEKMYKWNVELGWYILVSSYVFSVDRQGNVIANNLIITGGEIAIGDSFHVTNEGLLTARGVRVIDGAISIGSDETIDETTGEPTGESTFEVTKEGIVKAKSINIEEAYVDSVQTRVIEATESMKTNKIYLDDDKVYIERVTNSTTETQTVTVVSASVVFSTNGSQDKIQGSVVVSTELWYNKLFKVYYDYIDSGGRSRTGMVQVTVTATNDTGSTIIDVDSIPSIYSSVGTAFPDSFTEMKNDGTEDTVVINIDGEEFDILGGGDVNWLGDITFPTDFKVNDIGKYGGSLYVCTEEHTGTVFEASKWDVMVSGSTGGLTLGVGTSPPDTSDPTKTYIWFDTTNN